MEINLAQIVANNRANILSNKDKINTIIIDDKIKNIKESNLKEIKGVGEGTIKILLENGIYSQEDLKITDVEKLKTIVTNFLSYKAIEKFINT